MEPDRFPGFSWNAGGWFGSQLGGTAWILVAAIMMLQRDVTIGVATLAFFLFANLVGTWIWSQRERFRPYPAIQGLLVLMGVVSFAATFLLDQTGHFESLAVGAQASASTMYLVLALMIPGLMFLFHVIERNNRASRS